MLTRRRFIATCACGAAAGCLGVSAQGATAGAVAGTQSPETQPTPDLKYVTYCGLYCRLCDIYRTPVARHAAALRDALKRDGWERNGPDKVKGFSVFWAALGELSVNHAEGKCRGCRGGCGDPDCDIRKCARARHVEVCSSCGEYPCAQIRKFVKKYPNVIGDGMRQKAVGLAKWIEEQEARYAAGVCFVDLRNPT